MSFKCKNGKFIITDTKVNEFDTLYDALYYTECVNFLRSVKKGLKK